MRVLDSCLEELLKLVPKVDPGKALELQQAGAVLVDVHELDEIAQGSPAGAHRIGRSYLELRIENAAPVVNRTVS